MAGIIIYHKNGCIQCKMSMKMLDEAGVGYKEINVDDHPEYIDTLKQKGFAALPVVETESGSWSGFRPDRLREYVASTH